MTGLEWRIRQALAAGDTEDQIVAKLCCARVTIAKVIERVEYESEAVEPKEQTRRARAADLAPSTIYWIADAADVDPLTVRRLLAGLPGRPSTRARVAEALSRAGLVDLLPPADTRPSSKDAD